MSWGDLYPPLPGMHLGEWRDGSRPHEEATLLPILTPPVIYLDLGHKGPPF